MHRIKLLLLIWVSFAYASQLDIYLQEELSKKGKSFVQKLNRCIQLEKQFRIEQFQREGCQSYLEEFHKLYRKALQKYYEEFDKRLKQAKELKVKTDYYRVQIDREKFIIIKIPISPKEYTILQINHKEEFLPAPRCTSPDSIWLFMSALRNFHDITVYISEASFEKKIFSKNPEERYTFPKKIFRIELKTNISNFQKIKLTEEKSNNKITYRFNLPAVYYAYLSYDFVGIKKEFPPVYKGEDTCRKPYITVKEKPDSIFIRFINMKNNHVFTKDFMVVPE